MGPLAGLVTGDPEEVNLMYKLKADKKIDYYMFAIYIADDHKHKSTIKFGSWD